MTTIEQLKENTENFRPLQIKGKIRQVNPEKPDASGNYYQIIYIEDGTGDLKVKIKDNKLFIDPYDGITKSTFTLRAAKGPKNTAVGLLYLAEKEMLVVSEGAQIIEDKPEPIKEKEPVKEKAEPKVQSTEIPREMTEIPDTADGGPYLNRVPAYITYDIDGPSDETLREEFLERFHIYNKISKYNAENGYPFTPEALLPMTTSILIDARRANAKILDHKKMATEASKKKQQEPAPVVKEVTIPSKEPDQTLPKTELLAIEAASHNNNSIFAAPDFDGNGTIGKVFLDKDRRPKMIKWAYSKAKAKLPEAKKAVRDNIFAMVAMFNKYDRVTLMQEAMMHDVADANEFTFDFDKENKFFGRVDAKVNEIIMSFGDDAFNPHDAGIKFFSGDHDKSLS